MGTPARQLSRNSTPKVKTGILMTNTGGPEKLEHVQAFLERYELTCLYTVTLTPVQSFELELLIQKASSFGANKPLVSFGPQGTTIKRF